MKYTQYADNISYANVFNVLSVNITQNIVFTHEYYNFNFHSAFYEIRTHDLLLTKQTL